MSVTDVSSIYNELNEKDWEYEPIGDFKRFECSICHNILNNPISHSLCMNVFCKQCILNTKKCPSCNSVIQHSDLDPVPNLVTEQIANLKMKCKKCKKEMTRAGSTTHKEQCKFACPFGCDSQVTMATLKEHAPLKCSKCVIKCPYSEIGCSWSGSGGSDYQNHLQTCELSKFKPY